jgi:hypothetical protein
MVVFPYGSTVTIRRRSVSGKDEYGNDKYAFVEENIPLCVVQPSGSGEETNFADRLSTTIIVYFPYGTDVNYIDALVVNEVEYEIEGTPQTWRSPFSGNVAPIEVRATKITGVSS